MQNYFTLPLHDRCVRIQDYLNRATLKELHHELPMLLENIFGFGTESGWGLDEIMALMYSSSDFHVLRDFLSPHGTLLKVLHNLQQDPHISFDFPISCLPLVTQHQIEQGTVSVYISEHLQVGNSGQPLLILDAFELYMFHFAYYMVNPRQRHTQCQWHNLQECLYPVVLEDYLNHYLPLSHHQSAVTPPMHSTPHIRHSPHHHPLNISPVHGSLLRHSVIANRQQTSQSIVGHDLQHTELAQSNTLVQVIAEFWLGQVPSSCNTSLLYTSAFDTCLPSGNLVLVLRSFIKYLHYFTNSAEPQAIVSVYHQQPVNPVEEFKRKCMSQIIRTKLYRLLQHCFDRWPLDSSFRLVLETWLSYIQAWRYVDIRERNASREFDVRERAVTDTWLPFIADNLLFYTNLFREFLRRVQRVDLTSPFHAYMLFRFAKVFSQKNLKILLLRAETDCHLGAGNYSDIGASYLSSKQPASLAAQINELESPTFTYEPLLSGISLTQIDSVVRQALEALCKIRSHKREPDQQSWLSWLYRSEYTSTYGDLTAHELARLEQHLEASAHNMCVLAELPLSEYQMDVERSFQLEADSTMMTDSFIAGSPKSTPRTPQCTEVDGVLRLTDLGRRQVINGIRQFDITYHGDPSLKPIKRYESAILVRLLFQASQILNDTYGERMKSLCERNDFIGRISRVVFTPAVPPDAPAMSPMSYEQRVALTRPRIDFRQLASYRTMVSLLGAYAVTREVFGVGVVGFVAVILAALIFTVIIRAFYR